MYAQLTLVGNVGQDPEMRYTPSGVPVCHFSVAVNRTWTNAAGEKQEQVTHHIVAEGELVFLDHTETWTFKTGETTAHTFATMHEMRDGLVYRWSDYWDMQKFVGQFPGWFLEEMMKSTAADFTD